MFKSLFSILSRSERLIVSFLIFLMFLAGLLEAISIAILVPFISFLVNPKIVFENKYFLEHFSSFHGYSFIDIVFLLLLLIFFIFLLKTLFLVFFHFLKNCFVYKVSENISIKLFSLHFVRTYANQLNEKSSNLISNCVQTIDLFVDAVLLASIEIFAEILIILFLGSLLFYFNFNVAAIVFVFCFILFFLYQHFTKKNLKTWGEIKQRSQSQLINQIQESHQGYKDILVHLKENFFINSFSETLKTKNKINIAYQTVLDMPKYILELISVLTFVVIVYFILKFNSTIEYSIPILGLYTAVSFKMLPALNRIIVSAQKIRASSYLVNIIKNQLKDFYAKKNTIDEFISSDMVLPINFKKNIKLKNISFKFPNTKKFILKNINLTIQKGEAIGIMGDSGEGKSTLVNIISGFFYPTSGKMLIDNKSIQSNIRGWRKLLGFMPQNPYLFNNTILQNISLFSTTVDRVKVKNILKISRLDSFVTLSKKKLNSIVGERGSKISGGQAQRVALARTLYKDPSVLVFDEATSSLDETNEKKILQAIKFLKGKKTIIIISHKRKTLSFCDKIYKIKDKKINRVI